MKRVHTLVPAEGEAWLADSTMQGSAVMQSPTHTVLMRLPAVQQWPLRAANDSTKLAGKAEANGSPAALILIM
jgi:hypothetical protein